MSRSLHHQGLGSVYHGYAPVIPPTVGTWKEYTWNARQTFAYQMSLAQGKYAGYNGCTLWKNCNTTNPTKYHICPPRTKPVDANGVGLQIDGMRTFEVQDYKQFRKAAREFDYFTEDRNERTRRSKQWDKLAEESKSKAFGRYFNDALDVIQGLEEQKGGGRKDQKSSSSGSGREPQRGAGVPPKGGRRR